MADRVVTSVVLVDDHPVFRDGLAGLLRTAGDIEVVAVGGTGAVELTTRLRPDVLVIDLHMPGTGGRGDAPPHRRVFVADNPGIWADHCHNLPHAAEGLVAHVMYDGVHTPYLIGGAAGNEPE
jgi:hypothetical protein